MKEISVKEENELEFGTFKKSDLEFIFVLMTTSTDVEAMKKLGFNVRRFYLKKKKLKPYKDMLAARFPEFARDVIRINSIEAANSLVETMKDKRNPRRISACAEILDRSGIGKTQPQQSQVMVDKIQNIVYEIKLTKEADEKADS
jgi:hypothetical protein